MAQQGPDRYGVACLDVSTGEFSAAEWVGADAAQSVSAELAVLRPKELLAAEGADLDRLLSPLTSPRVTRLDAWVFEVGRARETLLDQMRTASLSGVGL